MLSSEDLERFYFQYQTEAVPLGMSVQTFCLRNNVPYNIFHKWYKDTRKKIVEVQVDGVPSGPPSESVPSSPSGDAILFAASEQLVVVLNALGEGFGIVTVGEDAGPGDGHTNGVESMLGRKADILLVAVVEITGRVGQKATLGDKVIVPHGLTLACHLRGTFRLVRGGCGAPNKALRQLLYAV